MHAHITAIQDVIGDTLLAWHRFKTGTSSMAEIENLLNYLATKAAVETFGTEGEITKFAPFEHYVIDHDGSPITEVAIQAMGSRAIRDNGSTRTITRALVSKQP